jgi:phosphate transport system protein
MPRETLDHQIHQLQDEILLIGSMVEQAMIDSIDALRRRDINDAKKVYQTDYLINEKRFAIENGILILIATQQPIAHDLRQLTAMLEVTTELERMGDYAKGIAKINIKLADSEINLPMAEIDRMAELGISMLHRSLTAFIDENPNQASLIPLEDDEVDSLYERIYQKVVKDMIANPQKIDSSNLILWIAHNLERMADRVTNICERTVFIATGELLELDTTDDEESE